MHNGRGRFDRHSSDAPARVVASVDGPRSATEKLGSVKICRGSIAGEGDGPGGVRVGEPGCGSVEAPGLVAGGRVERVIAVSVSGGAHYRSNRDLNPLKLLEWSNIM